MLLRNRRSKIALVGFLATLCIGGAVALPLQQPQQQAHAATIPTKASAIRTAVAAAENDILAIYSPIADMPNQSTSCVSKACSISSSVTQIAAQPDNYFSDAKAADPPSSTLAATGVTPQRLDLSLVTARNSAALETVMSPALAGPLEKTANSLAAAEGGLINGTGLNGCQKTANCTLTLAAGAKVLSYSKLIVNGSSATVTVDVQGWQTMAVINQSGNVVGWDNPSNTLRVNEGLTQQANGTWLITSRVGDFLPGEGP